MWTIGLKSFGQQFAERAWITRKWKNSVEHDIARCAVIWMINIACCLRFLVGVRSHNMVCWIMREDHTGPIFTNQAYNSFASLFRISQMSILETQELYGLYSIDFTSQSLLILTQQPQFLITLLRNFTSLCAISHDDPDDLLSLFCPE